MITQTAMVLAVEPMRFDDVTMWRGNKLTMWWESENKTHNDIFYIRYKIINIILST